MDKEYGNELNLEEVSEYIQSFTYLFNKKKFKKLLEKQK